MTATGRLPGGRTARSAAPATNSEAGGSSPTSRCCVGADGPLRLAGLRRAWRRRPRGGRSSGRAGRSRSGHCRGVTVTELNLPTPAGRTRPSLRTRRPPAARAAHALPPRRRLGARLAGRLRRLVSLPGSPLGPARAVRLLPAGAGASVPGRGRRRAAPRFEWTLANAASLGADRAWEWAATAPAETSPRSSPARRGTGSPSNSCSTP